MKNMMFISALVALAACGMSEDKFADKFADKACETCESWCDLPEGDDSGEDATADCDFDSKAAKECLKADWTCETIGEGDAAIEFPDLPAVCGTVYDCGSGDDDDDAEE